VTGTNDKVALSLSFAADTSSGVLWLTRTPGNNRNVNLTNLFTI